MKPYRLLILLLLPFSILSCREASFTDKYSSDSAVGILGIGEDIRYENRETEVNRLPFLRILAYEIVSSTLEPASSRATLQGHLLFQVLLDLADETHGVTAVA